jgi:hypothetical protein
VTRLSLLCDDFLHEYVNWVPQVAAHAGNVRYIRDTLKWVLSWMGAVGEADRPGTLAALDRSKVGNNRDFLFLQRFLHPHTRLS